MERKDRRVHFLCTARQWEALEALAQARKGTGGRSTVGKIIREAVDRYLAPETTTSKLPSLRRRSSSETGIRKRARLPRPIRTAKRQPLPTSR